MLASSDSYRDARLYLRLQMAAGICGAKKSRFKLKKCFFFAAILFIFGTCNPCLHALAEEWQTILIY
jgi:hypothetical protein